MSNLTKEKLTIDREQLQQIIDQSLNKVTQIVEDMKLQRGEDSKVIEALQNENLQLRKALDEKAPTELQVEPIAARRTVTMTREEKLQALKEKLGPTGAAKAMLAAIKGNYIKYVEEADLKEIEEILSLP